MTSEGEIIYKGDKSIDKITWNCLR